MQRPDAAVLLPAQSARNGRRRAQLAPSRRWLAVAEPRGSARPPNTGARSLRADRCVGAPADAAERWVVSRAVLSALLLRRVRARPARPGYGDARGVTWPRAARATRAGAA